MKKRILYLVAVIFAFADCNKKSSTHTPPQSYGHGGFNISGVTGLYNVELPRNCDTTITRYIRATAQIAGYSAFSITITVDSVPAIVTSVVPVSRTLFAPTTIGYVVDTVAFHIHATDSGSFPVFVFTGGMPGERTDSFKIVVH